MENPEAPAQVKRLENQNQDDDVETRKEGDSMASRSLDTHSTTKDDQSENQTANTTEPDPTVLTGAKLYILFAGIFSSVFLMSLNGSIVSTYTFMTFLSISFLGSLICSVSVSSHMFIVGRAVQGIGGAGLLSGAFMVIAATVPKDKRAAFIGVGVGISTIGSVIGPLIGGALTQHASWRWCFYINLPAGGFVFIILACLSIPEQIEKKPVRSNIKEIFAELDLIGFILFAPACIMFLLALTWGGNEYPWNSSTIIGLFCGAFVTFVIFGIWQVHRGAKAMIPPQIARIQLVVFGCFTSAFQMGALSLLSYYLPLWFQVVKNASPTMSGVMILPTAISQCFGAVLAGRFVQFIGYVTPWALIGSMLTAVGAGLITTFTLSTGAGAWIGYQILIGTGRGSVLQMPITAIQSLLPAKDVSIATAQVFFCQYLGASVFLSVGQTIFTNSLRSALKTYAPDVDAEYIINVGARAVRSSVSSTDLPEVLHAYNHALINTFRSTFPLVDHVLHSARVLDWVGGSFPKRKEKKSKAKSVTILQKPMVLSN
ncbi:hypothetical protein B7463_g2247, partial [Scytalidium lignicola]